MISFQIKKTLKFAAGKGALDIAFSEAQTGRRIVITGESGSGKTTLLRILAGLTRPDAGRIEVDGKVWCDLESGRWVPPQKRHIGMVFQNYALFPNMNVETQIRYAGGNSTMTQRLMKLVGLEQLASSYPDQLSGGQKQRLALARSLVQHPPILLLDEPFSAVDIMMRKKLQEELLNIQKMYNFTMFMVSHDYREIMKLADRVLIIQNGRIVKDCPPHEENLSFLA